MVLGSFPVRVAVPFSSPNLPDVAAFKDEPNHIYELNEYKFHNWFDFGFTNGNVSPLGDNGLVWRYILPDPQGYFPYILRSVIDTTGNNPAIINDGQRWLDWISHRDQHEFWLRFYLRVPKVKVHEWWAIFDIKASFSATAGGIAIASRVDGSMYPWMFSDGNTGNYVANPADSVVIQPDTWHEYIYHFRRSYVAPYNGVQELWLDGNLIISKTNVKTTVSASGLGIGPCNYSSKVEPVVGGIIVPGPVYADFGPMTYAYSPLTPIPPAQFYGYQLPAGTVIAHDSFTGAANTSIANRAPDIVSTLKPGTAWNVRSGTWALDGSGKLNRTSSTGSEETVIINSPATDVEVSMDATLSANADFGLVIREWNDPSQSYWYFKYDSVYKLQLMSRDTYQWTTHQTNNLDLPAGTTHNFKVRAVGTTLQCYVDDVLIFSITDARLNHVKRGFGIREHGGSSDCRFDNFKIVKAS